MSHALRPMRAADLLAADRLREQAGWNQTLADWERLLCWQPGGCFVAEQEGQVAGTVTTTVFAGAGRLAWLGMLLVDNAHRRQGFGHALFSYAVESLERAGVATVALDATPLGKTLYEQAGFVDLYGLQRQHAVIPDPGKIQYGQGLRPLEAADISRLGQLDAAAFFGFDRRALLRDLHAAHPAGCWLWQASSGRLDGYVLSRPGARAWYIGPLVARSPAVAEALLRAALAPLAGQSAMLDTLDPNPHASALAARYGFEPRRPFTRMMRGAALPAGRTDWYFAMAGPEIG